MSPPLRPTTNVPPVTAPVRDPASDAALAQARALARLLDTAVRIPGTSFRVGLDPIIGLVPGVGDLLGGALSAYVLLLAARAGASRTVLLRMLANLGTDAVVGAVPLAGDLFDAGFKANARNLALLEAHVARPQQTRRASRLFVAGVVVAAVAIVALVVVGMVALVRAIA